MRITTRNCKVRVWYLVCQKQEQHFSAVENDVEVVVRFAEVVVKFAGSVGAAAAAAADGRHWADDADEGFEKVVVEGTSPVPHMSCASPKPVGELHLPVKSSALETEQVCGNHLLAGSARFHLCCLEKCCWRTYRTHFQQPEVLTPKVVVDWQ